MLYTPDLLNTLQAMLARHLSLWGMEAGCHVCLLTVSENATFVVSSPEGKRHVLRLYRPGYHDDDEICSELQWMQALGKTDIVRIPRIIPTLRGELLTACEEAGRRWRIACFEYLPGVTPPPDALLPRRFRQLGAITARLHLQASHWRRPRRFCRKHWTYETMAGPRAFWGDWRKAGNVPPSARRLLERCDHVLREQASRLCPRDADYTLLHGDLRPANLLFDGETLAVIDFDDCGFSWKALDFANAISFMEDHPLVPELRQAWLSGYETVAPPSKMLLASMELFVMLRRMQLTAWMATHAETPTAQELGELFVSGTAALADQYLTSVQQAPPP